MRRLMLSFSTALAFSLIFAPLLAAGSHRAAKTESGVYHPSPGVTTVIDNPNVPRVYDLACRTDHATLIQVPASVTKAWCGDLQGWTVDGQGNYVSLKPLAAGLSTNLHVLTANGRMYNFRCRSSAKGRYTDVFAVHGTKGYQVKVSRLVDQKAEEIQAKLQVKYQKRLAKALAKAKFDWARRYAEQTFTDYQVEQAKTFTISKVYNDPHFTYFFVSGDEKPTVYLETHHGLGHWTREVLNFNVTGGDFYRVQKILEPGQRFVLVLRHDEARISRRKH
ncbi:MAG: TrbG/VirB9 family P-type conjugative transfer protein [Acidobacteriota bacterium]